MNTVHVPARARNKEEARRFLRVRHARRRAGSAQQGDAADPGEHGGAPVADDRFLRRAAISSTHADGLAQYFDRDTSEDLANVAMKGFQEFMLQPQRLESILATIERARERIYGRRRRRAASASRRRRWRPTAGAHAAPRTARAAAPAALDGVLLAPAVPALRPVRRSTRSSRASCSRFTNGMAPAR